MFFTSIFKSIVIVHFSASGYGEEEIALAAMEIYSAFVIGLSFHRLGIYIIFVIVDVWQNRLSIFKHVIKHIFSDNINITIL